MNKRLATRILGAALHPSERDEVLAEVERELRTRAERDGRIRASLWVWRQALTSLPSLVRRAWFRGTTGYEAEANRLKGGSMKLESLIMDARYALRSVRSRKLYVALAVITLALGIGGTTAIFGIARSVLLDPLPYRASEELVMFWNPFDWSEAELTYLRPSWSGFQKVAAYTTDNAFLRVEGAAPRVVPGIASSSELFNVLGAQPLMGRTFEPGSDAVGAEPTAVLSYGLWQELGGRADIIGSALRLDGESRRVVGVMPRGFWFPDPAVRIWLSQAMRPESRSGNYALVARMAPGKTVANMSDPLRSITSRLRERFTYPAQWDKTKDAHLTPLREFLLGPVRSALVATLAGMGVILLMACANVASLMLGQLRGRASELAVRMAIGANRRRLTQQLLIESAMLGVLAAIVGAAAAAGGYKLLVAALPLGKLGEPLTADWSLFLAALVIALLAALLIAMAPVFSLWKGDLRDSLTRARSGGIGAHGGRLEDALVIAEVSLAVLLAAAAAVLIRSVDNLRAVDSGVRTHGVAVVDVTASGDLSVEERWQHMRALLATMQTLPGVKSVAATQRLPLHSSGDNWGFEIEGRPDLGMNTTALRMVSRDYFATLGIKLVRGRLFEPGDRAESEPVIVIDEAMARKFFPGEDPIGRRVTNPFQDSSWARVIGVVGNVAHDGLTDRRTPGRYMLIDQIEYVPANMSIALLAEGGRTPAALIDEARTAIQRTDANFAVQETTTMDDALALAMGPTRRVMQLITLLGGLALVLGAVGVYGVVSHFVNRRKRDWVIRMALGMRPLQALQQVVGRGAALVAIGCTIGLLASLALVRLIGSMLYGVSAADPAALLGAAFTLIFTGCCAALIPAIRASRANAAQVLRESA